MYRSFGNFHVQLGDLGIRSYKGAKSDIGRSIAIVNRSQFLLPDNASEKVRLHYVAPFENWIDVNNAEDLELNQLRVKILGEDGTPKKGIADCQMVLKLKSE